MKYPKRVATVQDYINLLAMPEHRARALEELRAIRDLADDAATVSIECEPVPIFEIPAVDFSADRVKAELESYTGKQLGVTVNADETGILQEPLPDVRLSSDGKIVRCFKKGESFRTETVTNPLPVYRQKGFKSRTNVSALISEYEVMPIWQKI